MLRQIKCISQCAHFDYYWPAYLAAFGLLISGKVAKKQLNIKTEQLAYTTVINT